MSVQETPENPSVTDLAPSHCARSGDISDPPISYSSSCHSPDSSVFPLLEYAPPSTLCHCFPTTYSNLTENNRSAKSVFLSCPQTEHRCVGNRKPFKRSRRAQKLSWCICLRTPICAPYTPKELRFSRRMCSWLGEYEGLGAGLDDVSIERAALLGIGDLKRKFSKPVIWEIFEGQSILMWMCTG